MINCDGWGLIWGGVGGNNYLLFWEPCGRIFLQWWRREESAAGRLRARCPTAKQTRWLRSWQADYANAWKMEGTGFLVGWSFDIMATTTTTVTKIKSRQVTEFPIAWDEATTPYALNTFTPSARTLSDVASSHQVIN